MDRRNRREFMKGLGIGAAALTMPPRFLVEEDPKDKPNIVLILADDLGTECLGCYRGVTYKTPNIDALASTGVRFENCFCTPLCTPSRVQLMTGQYPFRSGWKIGIWEMPREHQRLDPGWPNFANLLKRVKYTTAVVGKWQLAGFDEHPDHARECGFDEYCLWRWSYDDEMSSRYWSPAVWQNGKNLEGMDGQFGPDIFSRFIIDFIRRNREKPFFAYYPMILPHDPFMMPPGHGDDRTGTMRPGKAAQQNFKAMVAYLDRLVGDIVRTLDELDLRKNTLILFASDNGSPLQILSKLKMQQKIKVIQGGKFLLNEAGTRVPLIASWPGVTKAGTVCQDLVDFTDVLPTIAELAGGTLPADTVIDGRSFLPQIKGKAGNPRDWVFCQSGDEWFIRDRKYRLMSDGRLFNMEFRYSPKVISGKPGPKAAAAGERLKRTVEQLMKRHE